MQNLSKVALLMCYFLILYTGLFYYPKWKQKGTEATISWDASGYYMYLPALFIYKDIKKCSFQEQILAKYAPTPTFQQAFMHASGNYVMKYSCGQAIMLSPFFFVGHFIAKVSPGYDADGFSFPYQLSIGIGMLLYAFIALWLLRKILLNYFNDKSVAIALISIVFATNYLNYAAIDGAMTHNTLFLVYTLLICLTIQFYKSPNIFKAVVIGILIGLATLTRPTEIISMLLPLFWGIASIRELRERSLFIRNNIRYVFSAVLAFIFVASIQLIYWKVVSGNWLVYSYQDEGFSWLHPHIMNGLFSYRAGWLTYSPVMLISLPGFIVLYRRQKQIFWSCFVFSCLFMYICFSWDIWWYGGSLGQRSMIQIYPVLVFPFCTAVEYTRSRSYSFRIIVSVFLTFCILYNLWLTHEAHKGGLLRPGEMTKAYYWAIFGKRSVDERTQDLLDNNVINQGPLKDPVILYENNFDNDTSPNATVSNAISGKSLLLDSQHQFSNEYEIRFPESERKWIRASADFKAPVKEWETWKMTQFVMRFYNDNQLVQSNQLRVFRNLKAGETKNIWLDAHYPKKKINRCAVSFWNAGSDKTIYIDNLKVIIFR